MRLVLTLLAIALTLLPLRAQDAATIAVASLSDPQKLSTLAGDRAANDRLLKIVYWLEDARQRGLDPGTVIDAAQQTTGHNGEHAVLVRTALLRNLIIAERLGLLAPDNLALMRRGRSPTVGRGPYAGEPAEVDHILPVSIFPEVHNELANLELMPRTLNRRKGRQIGARQRDYVRKFVTVGLLPREALRR